MPRVRNTFTDAIESGEEADTFRRFADPLIAEYGLAPGDFALQPESHGSHQLAFVLRVMLQIGSTGLQSPFYLTRVKNGKIQLKEVYDTLTARRVPLDAYSVSVGDAVDLPWTAEVDLAKFATSDRVIRVLKTVAALPPSHHDVVASRLLGLGMYGCVYSVPHEPCVDDDILPDSNAFMAGTTDVAYKVGRLSDANAAWTINKDVILKIDPNSDFTVPLHTKCTLRREPSADCTSLKGVREPMGQVSMRKGAVLKSVKWSETHVGSIVKLLDNCAKLTELGFVHGDIKPDNILYFEGDQTLRLIDFDLLSTFDMMDVAGTVAQVQRVMTKGQVVTRETALRALVRDPTRLMRELNSNNPHARFALAAQAYFPPENCITTNCVRARYTDRKAIQSSFHAYTKKLIDVLRSWLPEDMMNMLHIASQQYITDFDLFTIRTVHRDPLRTFLEAFYPDKHDAFQLGIVLAYFVGKMVSRRYISKTQMTFGLYGVLIKSMNDLLQSDPTKRESTRLVHAQLKAVLK